MTKRRIAYLALVMIISIAAGLSFVLYPDTVKLWIIQGIGVVWILEGITAMIKLRRDYVMKKELDEWKN